LIQGANTLSNGQDYTSNGPLSSAIAYLQTGNCLFNGENCAIVEMTLGNPTCPGCGSSVDISLIAPHALNVPTSFSFYNGCDGTGATCSTPDCKTAFFQPNDNQVQVACQTDNVDLLITFCGDGSTGSSSSPSPPPPPSSVHAQVPPHTLGQATPSSHPAPPPQTTPVSLVVSEPVFTPVSTPVSHATEPTGTPVPTSPGSTDPASQAPATTLAVATPASSAASPDNTSTPPKCSRSARRKRDAVVSRKVALEARELYDARIRGIARHARTAYSKRTLSGGHRL